MVEDRLSKYKSIARQVLDGKITIDSVSEFKTLLQILPDNPGLHAIFADLLENKKKFNAAAISYNTATDLYIRSGMLLSAILTKMMFWRIHKPSFQEVREFFSSIRKEKYQETDLSKFFNGLIFPELIAIVNCLERVRLSAGQIVRKTGDEEDYLYFIASGIVKDTIYKSLETGNKADKGKSKFLSENDVFGDIFPFEEKRISRFDTETTCGVELARISKKRLVGISRKFPNVARGLMILLDATSKKKHANDARKMRTADRRPFVASVGLEILPDDSSDVPIVLQGCTENISIGGVCVVLNKKYVDIIHHLESESNSKLRISFTGKAMTMKVAGTVMWSKNIFADNENKIELGIQFRGMTPKMSAMLVLFADIL